MSVLSDSGVPVEEISQLVGHSGTSVTWLVYRHQLRPVIQTARLSSIGYSVCVTSARTHPTSHSDVLRLRWPPAKRDSY
jgi:hypothetical protein